MIYYVTREVRPAQLWNNMTELQLSSNSGNKQLLQDTDVLKMKRHNIFPQINIVWMRINH